MDEFLAFDLEIAKELPQGETDWWAHAPLGISCAATYLVRPDGVGPRSAPELRLWHGPEQDFTGTLTSQMSPVEVRRLVRYLALQDGLGHPVVTWNGLSFDFRVLAEECQDPTWAGTCRELARRQIDAAFAMLCDRGFMAGLDAAAKGMGLAGKPEGMDGALAPALWAGGREAQERVLEYVAQDVRTTAELYQAICRTREMRWVTRAGWLAKRPWYPTFNQGRLLSVQEALEQPLPDTSWMQDPWPRGKFSGWLES